MAELAETKDIYCFVQIARTGSLTQAAVESHISKSTLSHALRRLEDTLGVELFIRSARGLALTDAGKAYLEYSQKILDMCETATSAAMNAHSSYAGRVRLAGGTEFGTLILGVATLFLSRKHPDMLFETRVYPQETLLTGQHDFDCFVCVGQPPDSDLLCRKLGSVVYRLYASPKFLRVNGTPRHVDDLSGLTGVRYNRTGIPETWQLNRSGEAVSAEARFRFDVDDYWMAKYYVVAGEAVGYLPDFFVRYEVEQGALVPVLPDHESEELNIWVLYPQARHRNPRVKLAVDALCENFGRFIVDPGYSMTPQIMNNISR
ncbi:MAG: LysR family transcriptional regulator [Rhizobiaceae bacterium]|nr:LysR family transcriptional regulator [Rhizobiaceae bacterium]|tara:strand:+ start:46068 stop:47021 length:954 start_codon:yes stop_codon:yes gene_type:complete